MNAKQKKYLRLHSQLEGLLKETAPEVSKMATIVALLHHKMSGFYWTGFYQLYDGELWVGAYQGPLACQQLKKDTGVCWAAINQKKAMIVPDVHQFEGHIACSSASKSELVVPLMQGGRVVGCLDIDSERLNHFDKDDAEGVAKILSLLG